MLYCSQSCRGCKRGGGVKIRWTLFGYCPNSFCHPLPALKSAPKRQIISDKSAPKRQIQARVKTPPKSNKGEGGGGEGRPQSKSCNYCLLPYKGWGGGEGEVPNLPGPNLREKNPGPNLQHQKVGGAQFIRPDLPEPNLPGPDLPGPDLPGTNLPQKIA